MKNGRGSFLAFVLAGDGRRRWFLTRAQALFQDPVRPDLTLLGSGAIGTDAFVEECLCPFLTSRDAIAVGVQAHPPSAYQDRRRERG